MIPTPYGQPFPPPVPQRPPMQGQRPMPTPEDRDRALSLAVSNAVAAEGYRVETQGGGQAILVKGGRTNHVLHLILTVITAGVWAIVWLIVALANKRKTLILRVDQWGNVSKNYS